ncbi:rod shape-determining protein MreC [Peptostreptococcaceae bacterium AGR-M142]
MRKKLFSKKNKEVIVIFSIAITLLLVSGASLKSNNNILLSAGVDIMSFGESVVKKPYDFIRNNIDAMFNYRKQMKKIEELESELSKLKKDYVKEKLTKEEIYELRDLKESLKYVEEDLNRDYISASVVAKNDGKYYTSFTVSAGKKQGVKENSVVVSGKGLVGRVFEISNNYSKAISLLDYKSSVSFQILRNSDYVGVINQDPIINDIEVEEGYLKGYLFDMKYDVVPGDILITSGLGIYPKGIHIGEIKEIKEDKNNLVKYIKVKSYSNLKNLDKVMIINGRNID